MWSILHNGAASTCAAVGADKVEVLSTLAGTTAGFSDLFTCSDLQGTTAPLEVGDYTVVISLLNGQTALGTSNPITTSINTNGETVELQQIIFNVTP